MNCTDVKRELMAWQLGDLHGDERTRLEAHLGGCGACVRDFIAVKRDVELAEVGPVPSPAARAKLRDAVKLELGLGGAWWERPVAFFVGAASVASALLVVINV
jgi:anti-sigma factor RsiW